MLKSEHHLLFRLQARRNDLCVHLALYTSSSPPRKSLAKFACSAISVTEPAKAISPRALSWRLSHKRDDLEKEDQARLNQLLSLSPELQVVYALLQAFLSMVRERKHQELGAWMEQATKVAFLNSRVLLLGLARLRCHARGSASALEPGSHGGQSQQTQDA